MPALLYVCESWTLTEKDSQRIQRAEMKILRTVAGYSLMDYKTNEENREELKIYSLNH